MRIAVVRTVTVTVTAAVTATAVVTVMAVVTSGRMERVTVTVKWRG